jgi:hypothetical protein
MQAFFYNENVTCVLVVDWRDAEEALCCRSNGAFLFLRGRMTRQTGHAIIKYPLAETRAATMGSLTSPAGLPGRGGQSDANTYLEVF